jgi:hypothetical protein
MFAPLADRVGALELREVRRRREAWDRDALAALREGDVERFAREYEAHGRIVAGPSAEAARDRLVGDWLAATRRGERAVMISHRRRDVADLNARARQRLQALRMVGADEIVAGRRAIALGNRVIARRNDRRLGVVNGDAGVVSAIGGGHVTVELDGGRRLEHPEAYALRDHLHHGYALTAHLAQGSPVDRAFVLGSDELYREWGYTALSRHRAEARFYVAAAPMFLNRVAQPLHSGGDATQVVTRMLPASRAERLALDDFGPDRVRMAAERALDAARGGLAEMDERLAALDREAAKLPWCQRARRRDAARLGEAWRRQREHAGREIARLTRELPARPVPQAPRLSRAADPLARLDRWPERPRRRERDIGIER